MRKRSNKYPGRILRVVDGDTFEVLIELGFGVSQKFRVRLDGIDTPETTTQKGQKAKKYVQQLIEGKAVILKDAGSEKYGRARAKIELTDGTDLTQFLIDKKIGIEYHGGKKKYFMSFLSAYPGFVGPDGGDHSQEPTT